MSDRLLINDIEIELAVNTVISITYQINDLSELKDRQANFSNQFKIPKTKANIAALQWSDQIQSTTDKPYRKLSAKVIKNGIQVVPKGFAIIESSNKEFNVTVYSGNIDFFELIDGKKTSDLDLSSQDHTFDMTAVVSANTNTSGYKYPLIDYGELLNSNRDVNVNNLRPALFYADAISQIFADAGIVKTGSIFSDANYLKILIAHVNGYIQRSPRWINSKKFFGNIPSYTITESGGLVTHSYYFGIDDDSTGGFYDNGGQLTIGSWVNIGGGASPLAWFTHQEPGDFKFVVKLNFTITNWIDGTSEFKIEWTNSALPFPSYIHPETTAGGGNGTFSITFEAEDPYLPTVGSTRPMITGVKECDIAFASGSWYGEPTKQTYFGSTVNMEMTPPPDMTQKALIKAWAQKFALFISVDSWTRTMNVVSMNEIIANIPNAKDWSDKFHDVDGSWTLEYRNTKYGRKNYLRYSDDSNDKDISDDLGDGYFQIEDETLAASATVAELPFAATAMTRKLMDLDVPLIRQIKSGEFTTDPLGRNIGTFSINSAPRLLIDDTLYELTGSNITYDDGVGTNNQGNYIPLAYFQLKDKRTFNLGFDSSLIDDYYDGVVSVLRKLKKLTALFKLTSNDIAELDHFTPVYLWQFSSYFYINKIISFKGTGLTKVELIRLGGGDVCIPEFGPNLIPNFDFAAGDDGFYFQSDPGDWTIDTSGALHTPNLDGSLLREFTATESPVGKWKIDIIVTGHTAGTYQAQFGGGGTGIVRTVGSPAVEIVTGLMGFMNQLYIGTSADFDGKIVSWKLQPQLTCL